MRTCEECGKQLPITSRTTKRYCSTRCRVAAHRKTDIPQQLTTQHRWVNWALANNRKIPINPNTGAYASSTDPATWSDYQTAKQQGNKLGYMVGAGIGCIDLDHCLHDGQLTEGASIIVSQYQGNYIEISPSGDGLHIWGTAPEQAGFRRTWQGQPVEFYSRARYITITGRTWQKGQLLPL